MSQNKYMHPRNVYKTSPNFKELAISFPEFRKFAKQDITGKVAIDFKDPEALRVLTTTLLQKDFGLEVKIPENRLIPTLPLRLNYLLWIEDMIELSMSSREGQISGVDIGTGASCIYPLLAAITKKWKMLATELDPESVNCARGNVKCNDLEDLITIKQVEDGTVLQSALDVEHVYDFTMCNPPFFSSEREADSSNKSRSTSRTLPHNGKTGSVGEVVVQGGEVAFILKMIQESAELKNVVKIFTTMVGHKSSLKNLKSELEKVEVASITQTEFCQGHTTRWGLAWTFFPEINLETIPKIKKIKEKPPMKYVVPVPKDPHCYSINAITDKLKELLTQLQIECKELKRKNHLTALEVSAHRNTWTHQRRRRREQKKNQAQQNLLGSNVSETSNIVQQRKYLVSDVTGNNSEGTEVVGSSVQVQIQNTKSFKRKGDDVFEHESTYKRPKIEKEDIIEKNENFKDSDEKSHENTLSVFPNENVSQSTNKSEINSHFTKRDKESQIPKEVEEASHNYENDTDEGSLQSSFNTNEEFHSQKKDIDYIETNPSPCVLRAVVSVRKVNNEIHIEMAWLEGSSGRDAVHQVLQYIKNNLKIE